MIDHFRILTKGGIVLWSYDQVKLQGNPVNEMIQTVLLQVIYQKILQLLYLEDLLNVVKETFCQMFRKSLEDTRSTTKSHFDFTDAFLQILEYVENNHGKRTPTQTSSSNVQTKPDENHPSEEIKPTQSVEAILQAKGILSRRSKSSSQPSKKPSHKSTTSNPKKPRQPEPEQVITTFNLADLPRVDQIELEPIALDNWNSNNEQPSSFGFFSMLTNLLSPLEKKDLEPVLSKLQTHLISKNVATEVAAEICNNILTSLEGKILGSFDSVQQTVLDAMQESLVRILTPTKSIDVLRGALEAKKEGRLYIITFCGVNGVGKSTNLAKIASLFLQNGFSVLLGACDTFRSGAIQQLYVHAQRIGVPLFEKGYGIDPTIVAKEAIQHAKNSNTDVLLIDTAGRMQGNEELMIQLSKLVSMVQPDATFFVGEALVGNDGVNQLLSFNKALSACPNTKNPRLIDGIILSKFDTVDDKVGSAVSMVYSARIPIVFLGTGQHYTELKRMNPSAVAKALLQGA